MGVATPVQTLAAPPRFRGSFLEADARAAAPYVRASGPWSWIPRAVAIPRDVDDVVRLVRWAAGRGVGLIPRGAGTGMPGGNVGPGVVVDLRSACDTLEPVDRDARTLWAGAGVVAARAAAAAEAAGLLLPALPSSADRCTLGGVVANDSAGARSLRYGQAHRWVDGLECVLADGRALRLEAGEPAPEPFEGLLARLRPRWPELSRRWPDVRKNASGYALDRFVPGREPLQLLVGSEGTLGIVTRVRLRLELPPERRLLLLFRAGDHEDVATLASEARRVGASACEMFGRRFMELGGLEEHPVAGALARDAGALVLVELDGAQEDVRARAEALRSAAGAAGRPCLEAGEPADRRALWTIRRAVSPTITRLADRGRVSMQFVEDSVVPPDRLVDYLHGIERILADAGTEGVVFGHAGDANIHVNPLVDVHRPDWRARVATILDATVDLVASLGGTLSGEHGDGRVRAPLLHRIFSSPSMAAFREVKAAFDPTGILNPGVILPLPGQGPLDGLRSPTAAESPAQPAEGAG